MNSKITMPADSTQADERRSESRRHKKLPQQDRKKAKKPKKLGTKDKTERRRRRSRDSESETDCSDDSDLDLDKELQPMATYVKQRDVLVEQMFHCISKKKLKRMLPEILKVLQVEELKKLCLEQLEVMSKKRIRRILDGDDPENISSSGTDEETTDVEEESETQAQVDTQQEPAAGERGAEGGESEKAVEEGPPGAPDSTDALPQSTPAVEPNERAPSEQAVVPEDDKSKGSSDHSSDDSTLSDDSRSSSRSRARGKRSRSRTPHKSRRMGSRGRSWSRSRSRSRTRTRSRSPYCRSRSRSRSLPYDRSTKSRTRSPEVSTPDSEWNHEPDGFYSTMPEDLTPPPVKTVVPRPSSPGSPEEGEVTDDDDTNTYVVVRHADGRTEVVTEGGAEQKADGEETGGVEPREEEKAGEEGAKDTKDETAATLDKVSVTKLMGKESKIVKRDAEGKVIHGDGETTDGEAAEAERKDDILQEAVNEADSESRESDVAEGAGLRGAEKTETTAAGNEGVDEPAQEQSGEAQKYCAMASTDRELPSTEEEMEIKLDDSKEDEYFENEGHIERKTSDLLQSASESSLQGQTQGSQPPPGSKHVAQGKDADGAADNSSPGFRVGREDACDTCSNLTQGQVPLGSADSPSSTSKVLTNDSKTKSRRMPVGFFVQSSVDSEDGNGSEDSAVSNQRAETAQKTTEKGKEQNISATKTRIKNTVHTTHVSKQVTAAYDEEESDEERAGSRQTQTRKTSKTGRKDTHRSPVKKTRVVADLQPVKNEAKSKKRKSEESHKLVPEKSIKTEPSADDDSRSRSRRVQETVKLIPAAQIKVEKDTGDPRSAADTSGPSRRRRIKVMSAQNAADIKKEEEEPLQRAQDTRVVRKKDAGDSSSSTRQTAKRPEKEAATALARKVVVDGSTGKRTLKTLCAFEEEGEEELDYDDDIPTSNDDVNKGRKDESEEETQRRSSEHEVGDKTNTRNRKIMLLKSGGLIVRSRSESERPEKETDTERGKQTSRKKDEKAVKDTGTNRKKSTPNETLIDKPRVTSKTKGKPEPAPKSPRDSKQKVVSSEGKPSSVKANIRAEEEKIMRLKEELRKREDELRKTAAAARLKAAGLLNEDLAVALVGKAATEAGDEKEADRAPGTESPVPGTSKQTFHAHHSDSDESDQDEGTNKRRSTRMSSSESNSDDLSEEDPHSDVNKRRERNRSSSRSRKTSQGTSRDRRRGSRDDRSRSKRSRDSRSRSRSGSRTRHRSSRYVGRMRSDEMGEERRDRHSKKPRVESSVSKVSPRKGSRHWVPPPGFPPAPRDFPPHFLDYPPPPEFFEQFGPMPYYFFPRGRGRGMFRGRARGRGAFMCPTSPGGRPYDRRAHFPDRGDEFHGRSRLYERDRSGSRDASKSRSRSHERDERSSERRTSHDSGHGSRKRQEYKEKARTSDKAAKREKSPQTDKRRTSKSPRSDRAAVAERRVVNVQTHRKRERSEERPKGDAHGRAASGGSTRAGPAAPKPSRSASSYAEERNVRGVSSKSPSSAKSPAKSSTKTSPGRSRGKATSGRSGAKKSSTGSREGKGEKSSSGEDKKSSGVAILTESQMEILELEMRARAIKAMLQKAKDKQAKKQKKK